MDETVDRRGGEKNMNLQISQVFIHTRVWHVCVRIDIYQAAVREYKAAIKGRKP